MKYPLFCVISLCCIAFQLSLEVSLEASYKESFFSKEIAFYTENSPNNLPEDHKFVLLNKIQKQSQDVQQKLDLVYSILLTISNVGDREIGINLFNAYKEKLNLETTFLSTSLRNLGEHLESLNFDKYEEWEKIDTLLQQAQSSLSLIEMYNNVLSHF